MQQDETAVAITLLQLSVMNQQDLSRVSIDVREQSNIEHVINDLEQSIQLPYIYLIQDDEKIEAITSYHQSLFLQGKTDIAITSVHAVFEQLQQLTIPARKMIDPESTILRSIEQAKQQALLQKSNSCPDCSRYRQSEIP